MPEFSQHTRQNRDGSFTVTNRRGPGATSFADPELEQGLLPPGEYFYEADHGVESLPVRHVKGQRKRITIESKDGLNVEESPIIFYIKCPQKIDGLVEREVVVSNGTIESLIRDDDFQYTLRVIPQTIGNVSVNVGDDVMILGNVGATLTVFYRNLQYRLKHRVLVNFHQNAPISGESDRWNNWSQLSLNAQMALVDVNGQATGIDLILEQLGSSMNYVNDGRQDGNTRYLPRAQSQGIQGVGRIGFKLQGVQNNYKLSLIRFNSTLREDEVYVEHTVPAIYTDNRKEHSVLSHARRNTSAIIGTRDVYGADGEVRFSLLGAPDPDNTEGPDQGSGAPVAPEAGLINVFELEVYETDDISDGVGAGYATVFTLDNNSIQESSDYPRKVGAFSTNGTPTPTITILPGALDSNIFKIENNNELWIIAPTQVAVQDIYQITVDASNAGGVNRKTFSIQITTAGGGNNPPLAAFSFTKAGLEVDFTGQSTDADTDPLTYVWDFGDGNSSTLVSPNHTYAAAGSYSVSLTVSDGTDTDTENQVITVGQSSGGGGSTRNIHYGGAFPIPTTTAQSTADLIEYTQTGPGTYTLTFDVDAGDVVMFETDPSIRVTTIEQQGVGSVTFRETNLDQSTLYDLEDRGGAAQGLVFIITTENV